MAFIQGLRSEAAAPSRPARAGQLAPSAHPLLLHRPQNDGGNQVTSGLFPFGGGVQLELHFVVSEMQITPVYGACQEQNTIYCTVTTLMRQGKPKSLHSKDFRLTGFLVPLNGRAAFPQACERSPRRAPENRRRSRCR